MKNRDKKGKEIPFNKMKNLPKKVFIQIGIDVDVSENDDFTDLDPDEMTFSLERIHPTDIEYDLSLNHIRRKVLKPEFIDFKNNP